MVFIQIDLKDNPLTCDCRIKWLYDTYHNNTFLYFQRRNWICAEPANLRGQYFVQLDRSYFAGCNRTPTAADCQIEPVDFRIRDSGQWPTHVVVWWQITRTVVIARLTLVANLSSVSSPEPLNDTVLGNTSYYGTYSLVGLRPGSTYRLCLVVATRAQETLVSCQNASTSSGGGGDGGGSSDKSSTTSLPIVLGVSIGCSLAVVVILAASVYCCCAAQRRQTATVQYRASLQRGTEPRRSMQTKRFRKQKASTGSDQDGASRPTTTTLGLTEADVDRAIADTVGGLDPYSRDVLLTNLLKSASTANLDRDSGGLQQPRYSDEPDSHLYESLPGDDDAYEIPPDPTV